MPDAVDARCKWCWGNRFCTECDGSGELPFAEEGQACPVCNGAGFCDRCSGTGEEPG